MADDDNNDREVKDGTPTEEPTPPDEELSYQEQLKKELLQLQKMQQTSIYPPKGQDRVPQDSITKETLVMDPNTPQLPQPDYTPTGTAKIKMLSTESKPGKTFSPEVERAIEQASRLNGVDPKVLRGFVAVESSGDPRSNIDRATQYKGLLQMGREEWLRHGGGGDIYNPEQHMAGAVKLMEANREAFIRIKGREPTPAELYLMHQQGPGFYTRGATTNLIGNLPPQARTAENLTREGFERWWTDRINRAIAARGTAPTMRKVEDSGLPSGFLYPGAWADVGGPELTKGGIPNTPEAQAEIAQLMTGKPLEQMGGSERAAREVAAEAQNDPRYRGTRTVPGVRTSRESAQVRSDLPGVNQTETLPIPGIVSPGEQAVLDATGPSMFSTIQNYQDQNRPLPPTRKPEPPPDLSFLDKLKAVMRSFTAPIPNIGETSLAMADAENAATMQQGEALKGIAQGIPSGLMAQPVQIAGGAAVPVVGGVGLLSDWDAAKRKAFEIAQGTEDWTRARQETMGIDPNNVNPAQQVGQWIGQNIGPGIASTLKNIGFSALGDQVLGPAAEYMAKNYPIPNVNPIQPAQAASAFGKPPLIVNTPGGPVVMNDEKLNGMVWGGIFALGIGAAPSAVSKTVRAVKEMRPYGWTGMADIFDPRREVKGAPGTVAASIPSDILKGGIVDNYQSMLDIADRQARYDKGVKIGIDPYAADAAKWQWRVQTGSGAQNLIQRVIEEGKMDIGNFKIDIPVPIKKLAEFSEANPAFPEYIKMRMIVEHLTNNAIQRNKLQSGKVNPMGKFPDTVEDNFGRTYNLTIAQDKAHRMEQDHPDFVTQHLNYQDNLAKVREFISDKNTSWIEHPIALNQQAMRAPSSPIFSHRKNVDEYLGRVLSGENPLSVTETAMREAIGKQMKFDAEQHYINNVASRDAFTPRTAEWVKNNPQAVNSGAVLTRKLGGQTTHWTADPFIVSMLNADHMPVTGWGQWGSTAKNLFQASTTGLFAPHFAPTGGIRAMEQGWTTAPSGVKTAGGRTVLPAGPASSLTAIPAQLVPRALGAMSPTVAWFENRIQNSNLAQLIDPKYHNLMSRAMEKAYNDSHYKLMLDSGAFSGTTLQQDRVIHSNITKAKLRNTNPQMAPIYEYMEKASDAWLKFAWNPVKATAHAANETLRAVQEAPNFAWSRKVARGATDTERPTVDGRPMSNSELAMRMRNYTGDPSTRGFIYSKNPITGKTETLNFQGANKFQDMRADAYKQAGVFAHGARIATPWAGVLVQSPAATLKAMRDNPVRAGMAFAASHVMPETAAYLWNMHQTEEDKKRAMDEGRAPYDYVNYMLNGRGDNPLLNNTYFAPVGGRPPQEGVEFRHYQEGILQRYMTRAWWQQYFGLSMSTMSEDLAGAAWGMLGGAIIPPQPSWWNAMLGAQGAVSPQGWLGGIQKRKINPYITLGGGESALELTARAIVPSLADMGITAYKAGISAPSWGDVPAAAGKAVGTRELERTAIVGDILGYKPPVAMSTKATEELWARKHTIDDLLYRWNVWDINRGDVKQKAASKEGGKFVESFLPDKPPAYDNMIPNPGEPQPEPKNPLYKMMMNEMQKTFERDMPSKGGVGWKSMWKDYMKYGSLVARMKTVNTGDERAWMDSHVNEKMGDSVEFLTNHGVNPSNFKQVRDFYAAQHNQVAQIMLQTIKATEQRIDQMPQIRQLLGNKHFTINMLDPNEIGIRNPEDYEGHEKSDTPN
jgi:hypothetical protein